jgi:signal peptidase I
MGIDDTRSPQTTSGRASRSNADKLGPISPDYTYSPVSAASVPPPVEFETPVTPVDVDEPKAPAKKHGLGAIREIVETLLLAFVIFVAVRAVVLNFRVDGSSMIPNLENKEMLLVNRNVYFHFDLDGALDRLPFVERDGERIVYLFHPPQRGDIIVFDPPTLSDKPYIKRVIGLPGDIITIENGDVYRNGIILDEPYIQDGITDCPRSKCDPVLVPEGDVYVLGDNRKNSTDSRIFGPVSVESIIGKAWITYWPLRDFGFVPHYDYPATE